MARTHPVGAPHFSWRELGNPPSRYRKNSRRLALRLEDLRKRTGGKPIVLVSSYRNPVKNSAVGGAKQSQHLVGAAADIPAGVATVEEAIMSGFTGIGSKGPWAIHVDVRPGPLARWYY